MATQSKAQLLTEIQALLKKRYKPKPDPGDGKLSVLEAVVYGVAHEGTTRGRASQALSRFKDEFFDWNEVRVSSIDEVQTALVGLPDAEPKAQRIRRFLRQLFEKTYGFTLDSFAKKPIKESLKALSEYEAFSSDYVQSTVVQQALGGHAIPVDTPAVRALTRLGVIEPDSEIAAVRSLLERAISKNRGAEFLDLLEDLSHDTCVEGEPDCPRCELKKMCPTAHARKEEAQNAARHSASLAKAAAKGAAKATSAVAKAVPLAPTPAPSKAAKVTGKGRSGPPK